MSAITSIAPINTVSHANRVETVLHDNFSQKVGDWAFKTSAPTLHNVQMDIPNAFSANPVDAVVIDYLEEPIAQSKSLPVAHLYDGALERVLQKIDDVVVKAILQEDLELRAYLKVKRIGEVYE